MSLIWPYTILKHVFFSSSKIAWGILVLYLLYISMPKIISLTHDFVDLYNWIFMRN